MKRIALFVMLAVVSVAAAGCVVAAVGAATAGTVVYVRGEVQSYFDSDVQTIYNATLAAMRDLKLMTIEQSHDALSARVVARNSEDQKVTVKVDGSNRSIVKVTIRVGFWGDEGQARVVDERIRANIKR